ncbi:MULTISPECIES: hypothetical protein [Frankia]|uniref:Uncharacterized protein n=2 Tax=Frankia TaxID=1854 RepID=Q0RAZ8_FRAAA|nr:MULTISPECIES: hypothetical protein [Frankia]CAJ65390.1 hypothetical protein; putative coiled-coil domain [Frankia alni ACN14a]
MSTTIKDRISHVTDTAPVSGLSDAAKHAADRAGTVAHRAASIAGETAGTAASATRDAGVTVAHRISDVSGSATRGGTAVPRVAGKAASKAVAVSGRAGRRIEKARSQAELSAERARAAAELRSERQRSRKAVANEAKARIQADKAQEILEKRLAKAEGKLARVHRRRRRGLLTLALAGAGAAGTVAVRRYLAQQDSPTITAEPAPIGSTTGSAAATDRASGRDAFDDRLSTSTNSLEEMPGVDTTFGEPSRPR